MDNSFDLLLTSCFQQPFVLISYSLLVMVDLRVSKNQVTNIVEELKSSMLLKHLDGYLRFLHQTSR